MYSFQQRGGFEDRENKELVRQASKSPVSEVCPDEKLLGKEGGGGECLGAVRHVGDGAVAGGDSQSEGGREQIIRWSDETH